MLDINKVESAIAYLQLEAKRCPNIPLDYEEGDDLDMYNAYDVFGGNTDDAYQGGFEDGRIDMASAILKMMGVE